jgi:hypothetical protein
MPYVSTPIEQQWPSIAARKDLAAEKRERQARQLREEAADLRRRWAEYCATRDRDAEASA